MHQVTADAVTASDGDTSFILQLRPAFPPAADPDSLSARIDQFVELYLGAAGLSGARYARLKPLTWAISTAPEDAREVELIRADLSETLFGRDDETQVHLVRQTPQETPGEAEPKPAPDDAFADWEPAHSSAATRAAMDDASDVLDLDAPDLDIVDSDVFEVDAWHIDDPFDPASPEESVAAAPYEPTADLDDGARPADPEADAEGDENAFEDLTEPPDRAAAGHQSDIARELAAFREEMRQIAAGIPTEPGSDALDQFRTELDSITGALGQRVDGAAQRIESAADRVADTVAGLPDAERMAGAVERAEASAELMESSVRDAVDALTAALEAMNGTAPSSENQADFGG